MKKIIIGTVIATAIVFFGGAVLATYFILNIPMMIIDNVLNTAFGAGNSEKSDKQLEYIRDYTETANKAHEEKDRLIEEAKNELADCDEIVVNDSFWINWIDIMTVDAIRVQQEFKKFDKSMAIKIAKTFISISTSKHEETRTRTTKDKDGKTSTEYYTVLVGVIDVTKKGYDDQAFAEFYLENDFKRSADNAEMMSKFLSEVYAGESIDPTFDGNISEDDIPVEVTGENITDVNYFNQMIGPHANKAYGPSGYGTYAQEGCGPTAGAIIFSTLKNDKNITPEVMGKFFHEKALRVQGSGTCWDCMVYAAKKYGCSSEYFDPNKNKMINHLKDGHILTSIQGRVNNELYTGTGHFVVLNGVREIDGKIQIHVTDPAYPKKIGWWDADIVLEGSKKMTAVWN